MTSGYEVLQNGSVGFPVPLFISETGCNVPEPRTFGDQAAIVSLAQLSVLTRPLHPCRETSRKRRVSHYRRVKIAKIRSSETCLKT